MKQPYYKAYDGRYQAIHAQNHAWATDVPTPIVLEMLEKCAVSKTAPILEVGCGEGRDSIAVLERGYQLLASDVSPAAIRFCQDRFPDFRERFAVVDACVDHLDREFEFIFATSVLHMLVEDGDRRAFLKFFHTHLTAQGKGLILTMGDGEGELRTDPAAAFELQERTNNAAGIPVVVPNTSCRMVSFDTFFRELQEANLTVLESGITESLPDFNSLMYAVVAK